jgi:histidinol-phosphate aminotransferase
MGLLARYRRFEDVPPDEVYRDLRSRRRREREAERDRLPEIDLSRTSSPLLPNTEVVNAAIAVTRTCVNSDPDPRSIEARSAIAEHHGLDLERVAVGNGAAELVRAAARALLEPDDELITSWPSYPLYLELAAHSRAQTVTVELKDGEHDVEALLAAVTERTRVLTLCNPNDPTGTYLGAEGLAALLAKLPERVFVLLDEALVHFQAAESRDAAIGLIERFPRLLVFRSFSKIYGLSGLRGGYAIGAEGAAPLLDALSPALGVNAVTQAAMTHAIQRGTEDVERRRSEVAAERQRLLDGLDRSAFSACASQANFIWLRADGASGEDLAEALARAGLEVHVGGAVFGDPHHVRLSIRDAQATDRVLDALAQGVQPRVGAPP